jgi:integrase/recombinase XerD
MQTLRELQRDYLDDMQARNFSPHTVRVSRINVGRFIQWTERVQGVVSPDQLVVRHLMAWMQHVARLRTRTGVPLRPASVNKSIENVRQFLVYLVKLSLVQRRLLDALELVKEPQLLPTSVLTHAQIKQVIAKVATDSPDGYRDQVMLELLYSTGMRVGELLGLRIRDVDLRNATALINGKGQKQRVVPIGKTALRCLQTYLVVVRPYVAGSRDTPEVFVCAQGRRVRYRTFLRALHAYTQKAGLDAQVTPHTFRRSCTTELLRGGANMYHVKELLGHESLETLKHYAKLTIRDLKKTHQKCHPREREDDSRDGQVDRDPS